MRGSNIKISVAGPIAPTGVVASISKSATAGFKKSTQSNAPKYGCISSNNVLLTYVLSETCTTKSTSKTMTLSRQQHLRRSGKASPRRPKNIGLKSASPKRQRQLMFCRLVLKTVKYLSITDLVSFSSLCLTAATQSHISYLCETLHGDCKPRIPLHLLKYAHLNLFLLEFLCLCSYCSLSLDFPRLCSSMLCSARLRSLGCNFSQSGSFSINVARFQLVSLDFLQFCSILCCSGSPVWLDSASFDLARLRQCRNSVWFDLVI